MELNTQPSISQIYGSLEGFNFEFQWMAEIFSNIVHCQWFDAAKKISFWRAMTHPTSALSFLKNINVGKLESNIVHWL